MPDKRSFREGYIKGWRTIFEDDRAEPLIPGFFVRPNETPYDVGHRQGVDDSTKLKSRGATRP